MIMLSESLANNDT